MERGQGRGGEGRGGGPFFTKLDDCINFGHNNYLYMIVQKLICYATYFFGRRIFTCIQNTYILIFKAISFLNKMPTYYQPVEFFDSPVKFPSYPSSSAKNVSFNL